MDSLVSVIIPTYKGADYIVETIQSVFTQSYPNIEIIVIIDGSPDNTKEILKQFENKIILITQNNMGIAGARNTGLRQANGEFICFLDHDDIWHKNKVEHQLNLFKLNPDVGVVYGNFSRWSGGDYDFQDLKIDDNNRVDELSGWIYHRLLETNYVLFTTAMFRRSVIDQVGEFDVDAPPADDWDMNIRLSQLTQFYKHSEVVALYRIHDQQTSQKLQPINYESEFRRSFIERYGLCSKNGQKADMSLLKKRFFTSDFDFAYALYRSKRFRKSAKSFAQLIKYKPFNLKLYYYTVAAYFLSVKESSFD